MKKDFDEKLVKQQKQFFDLFNSERIVSSAYRQDVSKQLTIILEKLNPDENLRTINDRFSQLEQKLEQMNLSGSEDRKAMLDGILHMQGQPAIHAMEANAEYTTDILSLDTTNLLI